MSLEKENETYQRELPNLVANEGKYVVIFEDKVLGVYGTYEDALIFGYSKCGFKEFLVKKIEAIEQVQFISRYVRVAECLS